MLLSAGVGVDRGNPHHHNPSTYLVRTSDLARVLEPVRGGNVLERSGTVTTRIQLLKL